MQSYFQTKMVSMLLCHFYRRKIQYRMFITTFQMPELQAKESNACVCWAKQRGALKEVQCMKKYLFFSIVIEIFLINFFRNYILISNISIIPAFLFVFSCFMGILYAACKGDELSFHIAPYTNENNGTTNNQYISKSYFITVPIYFLLIFFFGNIIKVCLSFITLFGTIIGYIIFTILKSKQESENNKNRQKKH